MTRRYELKRRAERQEATRYRIVEAAIELHAAGNASITAIAARAGVGRMTVYRHFPDERSLAVACTTAYFSARPMPDVSALADINDPAQRLRLALDGMYAYYADNEPMLASAETDMATHPGLVEALQPQFEMLARLRHLLAQGWSVDAASASMVEAAIGHALAFSTWRSLARDQRLARVQAVDLMIHLVAAGARRDVATLPRVTADGNPVSTKSTRSAN